MQTKNAEGANRYAEFLNTFVEVTEEFRRATGMQGNVMPFMDVIATEVVKRLGIDVAELKRETAK